MIYKAYYECPILWEVDSDVGRNPVPLLSQACADAGGLWLISGRDSLLNQKKLAVAVWGDTSVHEEIARRCNGVIEVGRDFETAQEVMRAINPALADAMVPQTFIGE